MKKPTNKWTRKHKFGLKFVHDPKQEQVFACFDFNGTEVWTEFGVEGEYDRAANFLLSVADQLQRLHRASQGKEVKP
jgi:hypothetical protein